MSNPDSVIEAAVDTCVFSSGIAAAERLSETLFDSIGLIGEYPELGSPVPDAALAARGYRRVSAERFWCYYVVESEVPRIYRVLRKGSLEPVLP